MDLSKLNMVNGVVGKTDPKPDTNPKRSLKLNDKGTKQKNINLTQ